MQINICILEQAKEKIRINGDNDMMLYIMMIVFSPITAIIPGIYAGYLIFKGKVKVEKNFLNIGLFVLFCWSLIVSILNNSLLSFGGAFLLLLYFAIGVVSQKYFITKERVNDCFKILVYLSALTAINGIIEVIANRRFGNNHYRLISAYGNANMAGAWFAGAIFIILYLRDVNVGGNQRRIYNLCLIPISIALFLTESTGAFVAFVVSAISYYIIKNIHNLKKMIIAISAIVFFAITFVLLQSKGNPSTAVTEVTNSFNSRYEIWAGSLKMFSEKPLMGWGTLSTLEYGNVYFPHAGNSIHSHNIYLTFLVTTGLIGFLIYLAIKFCIFKNMFILFKRKEKMLPLIIAINLMVIIQGLVDCSLYAPQLGIFFVVITSIGLNLENEKIRIDDKEKKSKVIDLELKSNISKRVV